MPVLHRDNKAVEGIPLKLVIIVLILAIALPLIWAGFENYDRIQKENDLRNEIEFIIITIKSVYTSGENNSQLIDVNFESGFTAKVEKVEMGDDKDGLWSSIRYKMKNRPKTTIIIGNPNIPVANRTTHGLDALIVGEGKHKLFFTARSGEDFDDDGFNDLYVEVSSVRLHA